MAAANMDVHEPVGREKPIQSSRIAANMPAIGVQSPASKSTPVPAAITGGMAPSRSLGPVIAAKESRIRNVETARRRTISPLPGAPFANVENSRCRKGPFRVWVIQASNVALIRVGVITL